jgi:hypothetical protein
METYQLSKADWNKLNKLGLVNGAGNGFANTTDKFDNNIWCNSHTPTHLHIKGNQYTFIVQYVSGCFYPIWRKSFVSKVDFFVDKNGEISRS